MNDESSLIVLAGLEGNEPTSLSPMQEMMLPYEEALIAFWAVVFCVTLVVVVYRGIIRSFLRKW